MLLAQKINFFFKKGTIIAKELISRIHEYDYMKFKSFTQ